MRYILLFCLLFHSADLFSQVVLSANGPGNTYSEINAVLAPGYNVIETPDCGHSSFGEHIDEVFDNELNANVFRFILHVVPDDDRCINSDRQRSEIKTYDKSPDNLLGVENEFVEYKWKFRLPAGFQSSPKFTHIHQLKSVGDPFDSMPLYTLTTRKGNPDRLELRHAETGTQVTLAQTDLAPFLGTWVQATATIEYSIQGAYTLEMKRVSDDSTLFSYSNNSIANWRTGASFIRPKWGIYRSLVFSEDLRDEEVLFTDFSIDESSPVGNREGEESEDVLAIFPNPASKTLKISRIPIGATSVQLYGITGQKLLERKLGAESSIELETSNLPAGMYILKVLGPKFNRTRKVLLINE